MDTGFGSITSEQGQPLVSDYSKNEGKITSAIEKRTAGLPSVTYLMAAGASIIGSLALFSSQRRETAIFVGMWAPTFLLLGIYNKLVKQMETVKPVGPGAVRH